MRIGKLLSLILIGLLTISCVNKPAKQEEATTKGVHPEWVYNATIYEVNTRQYTPEELLMLLPITCPDYKS